MSKKPCPECNDTKRVVYGHHAEGEADCPSCVGYPKRERSLNAIIEDPKYKDCAATARATAKDELDPVDQILYDAHELLGFEVPYNHAKQKKCYNRICHNVTALAQELKDVRRNLKYANKRVEAALALAQELKDAKRERKMFWDELRELRALRGEQ